MNIKKFFMGFLYAFRGIKEGLKERNMKFHAFVSVLVLAFGIYFRIAPTEWFVVLVLIGVVWSAELFNTALEEEANIMRDKLGAPYAVMGRAKDLAAGAVLVIAIAAAIIGIGIFLPRVYSFIF